MTGSELAGWISAVGTAGAFLAAAFQLWGLRRDALTARVAELDGVAVETDIVVRPTTADAGHGLGKWVYCFSVHNPGRLPISAVVAMVHFPLPVQRLHSDGTLDDAVMQLEMNVPVISAGRSKPWSRTVLVEHVHRTQLRGTQASVTFTAPDAGRLMTTWHADAQDAVSDRRVRKRVRATVVDVVR